MTGGGDEPALQQQPEGPVLPKYGGLPAILVDGCQAAHLVLANPGVCGCGSECPVRSARECVAREQHRQAVSQRHNH
jgi:hypothetical protein